MAEVKSIGEPIDEVVAKIAGQTLDAFLTEGHMSVVITGLRMENRNDISGMFEERLTQIEEADLPLMLVPFFRVSLWSWLCSSIKES